MHSWPLLGPGPGIQPRGRWASAVLSPRRYSPPARERSLTDKGHLVHQVHRQAHMVGYHPEPLSTVWHGESRRPFNRSVVFGQRCDSGVRMVQEPAVTGGPCRTVAAQDFAAGIDDEAPRFARPG